MAAGRAGVTEPTPRPPATPSPQPPSQRPVVAFLGTGTMGAPMARNVAATGLETRVWSRTASRAEPLADVATVCATVCATVAEAVAGADVVVTMLYDADSVAATMEGARGSLAGDAVWVQQSTVGVEGSDRLAALATDLGVAYLDAPVLGTKEPAEEEALVVLASGPEELRGRVARWRLCMTSQPPSTSSTLRAQSSPGRRRRLGHQVSTSSPAGSATRSGSSCCSNQAGAPPARRTSAVRAGLRP